MLELKMKPLTCSNSQKASENRPKAPWNLLAIYTKTFTKSLTAQIQDTPIKNKNRIGIKILCQHYFTSRHKNIKRTKY